MFGRLRNFLGVSASGFDRNGGRSYLGFEFVDVELLTVLKNLFEKDIAVAGTDSVIGVHNRDSRES